MSKSKTRIEDDLLTAVDTDGSTPEEISLKVQQAQEQLLTLKRQQEEIERQKEELESLSRKQQEFNQGRRDIQEKLTRGLVILERQEFELKRQAEQVQLIRSGFSEHLAQIDSIDPQAWKSDELSSELTRALAQIDQADSLYNQSRVRIDALREVSSDDEGNFNEENSGGQGFGEMVRAGFAYSLPLLLLGLLALLAYLFRN
jgi:DNA repair exonuclease SbcCD ATPase subunit